MQLIENSQTIFAKHITLFTKLKIKNIVNRRVNVKL